MALQLGALRDALVNAGAAQDKADAASEEVAAFDSRLTKLDTLATVTVALLVALVISHIAIWVKLGEIAGQVTALVAKVGA
jgi:hypothetical protein